MIIKVVAGGCERVDEAKEGEDGVGRKNCMEEVEKVLEEFSRKGEFAFGSFWGREGSSVKLDNEKWDCSVAEFEEFVEIVACAM